MTRTACSTLLVLLLLSVVGCSPDGPVPLDGAVDAGAGSDAGDAPDADPGDAAADPNDGAALADAGPRACEGPRDCPADFHCDPATGTCAPGCSRDEGCRATPATPVCDVGAHACVGCVFDAHCPGAEHCDLATQVCVAGCSTDEGCVGMGDEASRCDPSRHLCVACVHDGQCPEGALCTSNRCRPGCSVPARPCPDGADACCSERCVDPQADAANCGGCGIECAPGQVCEAGACEVPCTAGRTRCDGACVDLSASALHCGGCGMACAAGTACASGVCVAMCPAGQVDCGGACVTTGTDVEHCGACGNACSGGQVCEASTCACRPGTTDCGEGCVDASRDRRHCGFCGNTCGVGEDCVDGRCSPICPAGQTLCDGACRDLRRDQDHCGACGHLCPAGCVAGVCATAEDLEVNGTNSCVRFTSGRVFCWGNNAGMLVDRVGTAGHSASPVEIHDVIGRPLENVRQMAVGSTRACGVHTDGIVYCWGATLPLQQVAGLDLITQVSGFDATFCARRFDGTVRCWGNDLVVTTRADVADAAEVAVGAAHVCVRDRAGAVRCAGDNARGQLGDGRAVSSATMVEVAGLVDAVSLSAGRDHTCAVRGDGSLACWGRNDEGQLGDGTAIDRATPVAVPGVRARRVRAGGAHSCALGTDGAIWCWGANTVAQLGDGTTDPRTAPVRVPGLEAQRWLGAGDHHTCALSEDRHVRCWGDNTFGEAGGGTERRAAPAVVLGITGARAMAQGGSSDANGFRCVVLVSGGVQCWGGISTQSSAQGQLGSGDVVARTTPAAVSGLVDAVGIASGVQHTCVVRSGGAVSCWGSNAYGQLGHAVGGGGFSAVPVQVSGLTDATQVVATDYSSCALRSGGTVRCWGYNFYGQLGNGMIVNTTSPVDVAGLTGVRSLSTTPHGVCALRNDGAVLCWGRNIEGELADGTSTNRYVPGPATLDTSTAMVPVPLTGVGYLECAWDRCLSTPITGTGTRVWGDGVVRAVPSPANEGVRDWAFFEQSSVPSSCVTRDGSAWTCSVPNEWGAAGTGSDVAGRSSGAIPLAASDLVFGAAPTTGPNCAVGVDGRAYCWGRTGGARLAAAGLDALTRRPADVPMP